MSVSGFERYFFDKARCFQSLWYQASRSQLAGLFFPHRRQCFVSAQLFGIERPNEVPPKRCNEICYDHGMANNWSPPEGHPLSEEQALQLLQGDLGDVYRNILRGCCAPVYWHRRAAAGTIEISDNGTLTFVNTGERLIGLTAAHVVEGFDKSRAASDVTLQVMNVELDGGFDVIDIDTNLDIATISVDPCLLNSLGKAITPLEGWPPLVPEEGRGIMLAGYPGIERLTLPGNAVSWGLFTAMGIARRVTSHQITWLLEREHGVPHPRIPDLPPKRALGGISGGPLIAWFETPTHITYPRLGGIISQASAELEIVVARRADFIQTNGSIISHK